VVSKDLKGLKVLKVLRVSVVIKAFKEVLVHKDLLVLKASKDSRAVLALKD
jgi:hypothetical protein